jgi:hypothetical protein
MIYLVILVLAASASIGRLWLLQRRERSHLQTVEGFREGWERLSEPTNPTPVVPREGRYVAIDSSGVPLRKATPRTPHRRPERMDPKRRAEAKRRLEARRAAMQRAAY